MANLLEVKDLRVSYHTYAGEVHAVRGVSLEVDKGESVAIVGESGCGKTVTSKSIMGLISMPPGEIKKESRILFEGKDLLDFSEKEWQKFRGAEAGMIFQDPMTSLNPLMKVGKQIMEGLIIHRAMTRKEALQEAVHMLEIVNIPNAKARIEDYPYQFSGGMRQRVMIAMALACNPKLLIADEPTTALDVTIQAQILELLQDIQEKFNTAIILITHDLGIVAGSVERVIVMYAGQIIEQATVEELFHQPRHPYTEALLRAVPGLKLKNKSPLASIHGKPPDLLAPPSGCAFASRCRFCMKICKTVPPSMTRFNDGHKASCWLYHDQAPKVDLGMEIGEVI
ncbi:MAG TPA: peptide ABC transporter ATP-binding protein [Firmicutes bacterium]|jgi:oligopeptide transport system ATP-binding protein|nr:peptide ABC transporter ATP-binding protein [Bacillota bacterium]